MASNIENALRDLAALPSWDGKNFCGLEIVGRLFSTLGDPQNNVPAIHVAGTNGKGSVCALVAAMLRASGKEVGQYSSPHLVNVNERCVINGLPVSMELFAEAINQVLDAAKRIDLKISYFVAVTAASFLIFSWKKLDWALIEAGLGGRLDATNLIERARVSVITSIGLEHTQELGDTLSAIAREKAGIMRQSVAVYCGNLPDSATAEIRNCADSIGTTVEFLNKDFHYDRENQLFKSKDGRYYIPDAVRKNQKFFTALHSQENTLLAVRIAQHLGISDEVITKGILSANWPGRLEQIKAVNSGGNEVSVILDAAHNPDGVRALCRYLDEGPLFKNYIFLLSILNRKNWQGMLDQFLLFAQDKPAEAISWILTTNSSGSSENPDSFKSYLKPHGIKQLEVINERFLALKHAVDLARSETRVVVSGSIYLIGEIRQLLLSNFSCQSKIPEYFCTILPTDSSTDVSTQ